MLISIITVSYNSERLIEDCIESVNNQDYSNIEHILIDGDSTDKTVKIFKEKAIRSPRYLSEKDNGIYHAMNKGISLATGELIGFLNSDDKFYNEKVITTIVKNFRKFQPDIIYGNLIYVNTKGAVTRRWISQDFRKGLFQKSWTPAHPTFYCTKKVYKEFPNYRTDYSIASDVDLMFRFLELYELKSKFINSTLVTMLQGGVSNQSIKSTLTITKEVRNSFLEAEVSFNIVKYLFHKIIKALKQKEWVH